MSKERTLRKHLRDLGRVVELALAALDAEMKKPSTPERGRRIAAICNALELENDRAKHFGLDMPLGRMLSDQAKSLEPVTK